ncbi:anaerobic glycerol-3-phosphate dehydrogenase subunit GlpB [Mitsuokella multacida]|jgi:glycerol-3-phosphate dehydrogenase subunit B|uniref:anaerobic glycerol-3-phosphate dehydrogenase subunit GlpB n=1 Tax=Mitsuokella multacida TaxID=52226 RepID=UPI000E87A2EB|nr:anaerobic glycerol-3-phosphate dehydrogenase subunit GlpB [Mitsuokella multacida]HBQ30407.1 anaerobic glycerol-3-phosphate dehydrogenase subunit B [Mitsuokella multacida]
MIQSDVIVIGGGMAGMIAALASAKDGKRVTLLTYGEGTLPLNSGVVDILAYDSRHQYVRDPMAAIESLPEDHPYHRIGRKAIEEGITFFREVMAAHGLPYAGTFEQHLLVPTAVGTLKPTSFAPRSLAGSRGFKGRRKIVVISIRGLKDFYGSIMLENLKKALGEHRSYEIAVVDPQLGGGRDITTQDVARWLESDRGGHDFVTQLRSRGGSDVLFIVPQVLGLKDGALHEELEERLGTSLVETTCLPPSVNGMRVQRILRDALRDAGVDIVENTRVVGSKVEDGRAVSVLAQGAARKKEYRADCFILATGGFYSGGITMREFDQPQEVVFNLPVSFVRGEENWANDKLFSNQPQGFARTGIMTDEAMRPIDAEGHAVLENVRVCGRMLAGYDFCFEHSGNGVAISSAYKAARG